MTRDRKKISPATKELGRHIRRLVIDTDESVESVALTIGISPAQLYLYMNGYQLTRHVKFLARLHKIEAMNQGCAPDAHDEELESLRSLVRSLTIDRDRARERFQKGGGHSGTDSSHLDRDDPRSDEGNAPDDSTGGNHRGRRSADLTSRPGRDAGGARSGRLSARGTI